MLKITDDSNSKWHFLARPTILDEDGVKRPTKSFSRLMEGISSKRHGDFYCFGCLHSFCTQSTLKNHVQLCKYSNFCKIELPQEDRNINQYSPGSKWLRMNSVIYADFESILMPYSTCDKENITTKKINKQGPCGYSLNVVANHNKKSKQTYHRGTSTVETFCNEVHEIARELITIEKKPLEKLSNEQQSAHDNAEYCYICKKVFANSKKHRKVRDHDHYTGKYRGAACNLRYTTQVDIPVFFHNGTNYDFNLIMTELAKEFRREMKCIPLNTNKYMSFSIPIAKKKTTYEPKTQNEPKNRNKPNEQNKQKEQNEQNEPNKEKKYKKPKKSNNMQLKIYGHR